MGERSPTVTLGYLGEITESPLEDLSGLAIEASRAKYSPTTSTI